MDGLSIAESRRLFEMEVRHEAAIQEAMKKYEGIDPKTFSERREEIREQIHALNLEERALWRLIQKNEFPVWYAREENERRERLGVTQETVNAITKCCSKCGEVFQELKKKGRPPTRCAKCR